MQLARIYPGYQRFFLACDEELSPGVGRPKPETAHEKSLAPRVARITSKVKNIPDRISLSIFRRMKEGKITQIGHFRVPQGLCIKTRLGAQPLIRKWFFILMQIKFISSRNVEHLTSFWHRGPGGLGNGLLSYMKLVLLILWLSKRSSAAPAALKSSTSESQFTSVSVFSIY